ncbi:4a-hydroxytetrahydrobiopterin dehydratase [Pelagibacterales bacterium SAG-MED32]|nr:4a-hydroxytetrahydrobiopterin dehydratase [Pelagibacterales bacterium SAG-MED32]
MIKKLTKTEVTQKLKRLSGWKMVKGRNAITKTFKFKDFIQAFGWMTAMAIYAEKKDHHPEWFNVYSTVEVVLSTHDIGGVSNLDIELAKKMNSTSKSGN